MKNPYPRKNLIDLLAAACLALACLALSPLARAVDPPPDGGYQNANTAEGEDALFSLANGVNNTAIGYNALFNNTTAEGNTATGWDALASTTTGSFNTATGWAALISNKGGSNTATGGQALQGNTTGFGNTATGGAALVSNTTGGSNTATGLAALFTNTIGSFNVATGHQALYTNQTGNDNTAIGENALMNNRLGSNNIALGTSAGSALTTGDNNIDIGNAGIKGESNHIRIGTVGTHKHTFIAGISGVTVAGGVGVIVDTSGHLGTVVSSRRFKDQIKPMDKASEAILALQPVTFHYKKDLDPDGIPQFGLVAEQVEKVDPDLVARDERGKPYTVRYEAVNAMLLNEFLKEHRGVEDLKNTVAKQAATITQQQEAIAALTAALKAQAAQIQTVSDQIGIQAAAPGVVAKN